MTDPVRSVSSRRDAEALDELDSLKGLRAEFLLPEETIYLDGNSLGPLAARVNRRVSHVMSREWGRSLIRSWNEHGWIELPLKVGDAIGSLIGALPGEVVAGDSTSVNLFKALFAALSLRPERTVILSEEENFPTDLYIAQGVSEVTGGRVEFRVVPRGEFLRHLDASVAAVLLTHVDFRTGELHDMAGMNRAAHAVGALTAWDLSHSVGAVEVDLRGSGADFAIGCGYKYLNGGPGAPAFLFVASELHERSRTPLPGWLGHASPFEFDISYRPAPGIARFLCGTPPILSLAALDEAVETIREAGIPALRKKSVSLTQLFIELVEPWAGDAGFTLASPREPEKRGSQVSYRHPAGYPIVQALIREGVIGDFRAPDILRFGFAPAYLRHVDVWDAAQKLRDIVTSRRWDRPEFRRKAKVT